MYVCTYTMSGMAHCFTFYGLTKDSYLNVGIISYTPATFSL